MDITQQILKTTYEHAKQQGMTQQQFAQAIGISRSQFSAILHSRTGTTPEVLNKALEFTNHRIIIIPADQTVYTQQTL